MSRKWKNRPSGVKRVLAGGLAGVLLFCMVPGGGVLNLFSSAADYAGSDPSEVPVSSAAPSGQPEESHTPEESHAPAVPRVPEESAPAESEGVNPSAEPAPDGSEEVAPSAEPSPDESEGGEPSAEPSPDESEGVEPSAEPSPTESGGATPSSAPAPVESQEAVSSGSPAPSGAPEIAQTNELEERAALEISGFHWQNNFGLTTDGALHLSHATKDSTPLLAGVGMVNSAWLMAELGQTAKTLNLTYQKDSGEQATVSLGIEWSKENISNWDDVEDAILASAYNGTAIELALSHEYVQGLLNASDPTLNLGLPDSVQPVLQLILGNEKEDGTPTREQLAGQTIATVSPSNVKVNLFDYTLLDQWLSDQNGVRPLRQLVSSGINSTETENQSHALLFFRENTGLGDWNRWTGKTGGATQGLVNRVLGEDGYPTLNISGGGQYWNVDGVKVDYDPTESLAYLFDPDTAQAGKESYEDVTGLFKVDANGNYYYSSGENFAEFDEENGVFRVYNRWAVKAGGSSPNGQFFPFNSAQEVFDWDEASKSLAVANMNSLHDAINHYLGLSMEVEFQQPPDGMVSVSTTQSKPMVFQFSGDDDVWVFIDGVLVADLGGIHDEMKVSIDFSSGAVTIQRAKDPNAETSITTTLRAQFEAAGKADPTVFDENTFAGNTQHKLQMFYLERGNTDSNLTLSFNLMEPVRNELVKVDEDGNPLQGAAFDLYAAKLNGDAPIYDQTTGQYAVGQKINSEPLVTGADGVCALPKYDYSAHTYYVLRETSAPEGCFSTGDVLLKYDRFQRNQDGTATGTNLLLVENHWETGANASFVAQVYQAGELYFQDSSAGVRVELDAEQAERGLIVAVPMLRDSAGVWQPLYGSGLAGYHPVACDDTPAGQRRAILTALLYQIYGATYTAGKEYQYSTWYLDWDDENDRFQAQLTDLPGDVRRYYWASQDASADMAAAYYFLDLEQLSAIFGAGDDTTQGKFERIVATINQWGSVSGQDSDQQVRQKVKSAVEQLVSAILNVQDGALPTFGLLNLENFNRVFASRVYVPNIRPELAVQKLDENGQPVAGVGFALYSDAACTDAYKVQEQTTDTEGLIIFSYADSVEEPTYYYIKEISAPEDYIVNETVVPVLVMPNGRIFADALEANDGVTVRKGLGYLLQTMARYAVQDSVDVTLQDITAVLLTAPDFKTLLTGQVGEDDIAYTGDSLALHYGMDNALLEYGTHLVNGVQPNPYFEVDTGIAALGIHQNFEAHKDDATYNSVAEKTDLGDTNIRGLFTGSTVVVMRNRSEGSQGAFSIQKQVSLSNGYTQEEQNEAMGTDFYFEVVLGASKALTQKSITVSYAITQEGTQDGTQEGSEFLEQGELTFTAGDADTAGSMNYRITQVSPDNGTASAYFVESGGTGVYRAKLHHKQTLSVTGVPFSLDGKEAGWTVTASEVNHTGWTTSVRVGEGGQWSQGDTASAAILAPPANPVFYFNNYGEKVTDLTVAKYVDGYTDTVAYPDFPFVIALWDEQGAAQLTKDFAYSVTRAGGGGETGTMEGGRLSVNLGHGDTLTIQGIPLGTTYVIQEASMGYTPAVTVNGQSVQVNGGAVSGKLEERRQDLDQDGTEELLPTRVEFTNSRTGSITITKRNGEGGLLSGAGFTLARVGADGTISPVRAEQFTYLVMRTEIDDWANDTRFDQDTMRYLAEDGASYIVHTVRAADGGASGYFYYRPLTRAESEAFNAGKWTAEEAAKVEAIVQFADLPLTDEAGAPIQYAIRETTIPDGYMQNGDIEAYMSDITLPMQPTDGAGQPVPGTNPVYDVLYTVSNFQGVELPVSGLSGVTGGLMLGALLLGGGAAVWLVHKQRVPRGRRTL